MSGKLKILPHKRWNVWNRDNVEKVLRDERVAGEAAEAKAGRERGLISEAVYARLGGEGGAAQGASEGGGNTEHASEAREAEQRKRKRDGKCASQACSV